MVCDSRKEEISLGEFVVREFGKMKNIVRELVNQAFLGEGASRMATL